DDYASHGIIKYEPSHFAFETYDITLHTFMSRLTRNYLHNPAVMSVLDDFSREVAVIKEEMAGFNFELFHRVWEAVIEGRASREAIDRFASEVENRYAGWIEGLKRKQIKIGMMLKRSGVPLLAG